MKKLIVLCFVLVSGFANASPITVNFEVTNTGDGSTWGTGSFAGIDNDNNGLLTLNELTMFDGSNNFIGFVVNLANLFDMGDFDISNNIWISNAVSWNGSNANNAWFTWENRGNSVFADWAEVSTSIAVSEPASLLALGLISVIYLRRRKIQK